MNNVTRRLITAEKNNVELMVQMTIRRRNLGGHNYCRTLSTQAPPHDSSSSASTTTTPRTHLRTSLLSNTTHGTTFQEGPNTTTINDKPLISYARGWAWQQTILNRRLEIRRQRQQQQHKDSPPQQHDDDDDDDDDDPDVILMLEHEPVYTLGRGADENHLTFLTHAKEEDDENHKDKHDYNQMVRERLSRSSRGIGSARLSVDRQILTAASTWNHPTRPPPTPAEADLHMVQQLSELAVPVMAPNGCPIYRIERGGEVTWHGPGQLVVYPLLDLTRSPYQQDLHWYLRQIEEVIIRTLDKFSIHGQRDDDDTGVWVTTSSGSSSSSSHNKIAAVGVSSSRWITTHGFAINVCPNLDYFDTSMILPCGIEGKGVTSIMEVLMEQHHHHHQLPTIEQVAQVTCQSIEEVFGIEIHQHDDDGDGNSSSSSLV